MKRASITKQQREKSIVGSARLEGLSFARAKKNKKVIARLKQYGRAFSI